MPSPICVLLLKQMEYHFVKKFTRTVHGTNRSITMDNWFTSVPLAKSLVKEPYKLTLVGTVRANKRETPATSK